jgi:hypothetical protein
VETRFLFPRIFFTKTKNHNYMKKFYFLVILLFSALIHQSNGQQAVVFADPSVENMSISTLADVPISTLLPGTTYKLKINLKFNVPNGVIPRRNITIGITFGGKLMLEPAAAYDFSTAGLNTIFTYAPEINANNAIVYMEQIGTIPNGITTAEIVLLAKATGTGTATAYTNIYLSNENAQYDSPGTRVSELDPNNNSSLTSYNVNPCTNAPTITPGNYGQLCINASAIVLSGVPSGGTWTGTGVSNNSFNPSTAGIGSHSLTYSINYNTNCTASAKTTIEVKPLPVPVIETTVSTLTCTEPVAIVTASSGFNYIWTTGNTTTNTINVSNAGSYGVSVTDQFGCVGSTSIIIYENKVKPTAGITTDISTLTCASPTAILTASGMGSYVWSNGQTGPSITVSNSGTYSVVVTGANGCTNTASQVIAEDKVAPSAGITSDISTLTCASPTATLTASGMGSYVWNNGQTGPSITVSNSGTYSVVVTGANGCSNTASRVIAEDKIAPTASITPVGPLSACPGQTFTLTANTNTNNVQYSWGPTNSLSVTQTGEYSVTITNLTNGCKAVSNEVVVILEDKVKPVLSGNLDRTVSCSDAAALASAQALLPTATDNCGGSITITKTLGLLVNNALCSIGTGTITNTFTATDTNGNTSTFTQLITIVDTTPPSIQLPASFIATDLSTAFDVNKNANINLTANTCNYEANFSKLSLTDNCTAANSITVTLTALNPLGQAIAITTNSANYSASLPVGQNVFKATAIDACGNSSTLNFTVTIIDKNAPIAPALPDITNHCGVLTPPILTDVCGNTITPTTTDPVEYYIKGTYFVKWTWTDAAGNTASATQQLTVQGGSVLTGKVVEDISSDGKVNGNSILATSYVSLYKNNLWLSTQLVTTSGYTMPEVCDGTYKLIVHAGNTPTNTPSLPLGYNGFAGEGPFGLTTTDLMPNGIMSVSTSNTGIVYNSAKKAATAATYNVSFGLSPAALPIQLLSFQAKAVSGFNSIDWKTSNESNFSHFVLEKSTNAIEFQTVNSFQWNKTGLYQYKDRSVENKTWYYRLKMVDIGGAFTYSAIVKVLFAETSKVTVSEIYPNPVLNNTKVTMDIYLPFADTWNIQAYNASGKVLSNISVSLKEGNNKLELALPLHTNGLLFYRFSTTKFSVTKKLNIIK